MARRLTHNAVFERMASTSAGDDRFRAFFARLQAKKEGTIDWRYHAPSTQKAQNSVLAKYYNFNRGVMKNLNLIENEADASEDEVKDFSFPPDHKQLFDLLRL